MRTVPEREPDVRGVDVDAQTRCAHYGLPVDIVAIKMRCCLTYYACIECHAASADHVPATWPRDEWDESAILCGACRRELTIRQYLASAACCPACGATFNPRCAEHHDRYFEALSGAIVTPSGARASI